MSLSSVLGSSRPCNSYIRIQEGLVGALACNGHINSFFQLLQLWIPVYLLVSTPKARRFQTTVGHVAGNRPTSSFGPTVDFLPLIDWVAHGAMKHATASWSTAYSKHKKHKNPN